MVGIDDGSAEFPSVSVVIPIYQGESYVKRIVDECIALRSINPNVVSELIFVCDDPVDGSLDIARGQSERHRWITVIELAFNTGQHVATSVGVLHASAEWIITLDEDLQCPVHMIPIALRNALSTQLDLLYVRPIPRGRRQRHGVIRNMNSNVAKLILKLLTEDDFSFVSSFRLIRASVARSIAFTVDRYGYLDTSLMTVTSVRRRGFIEADLVDTRPTKHSGYPLSKLIKHYGRLLSSVSLSGKSLIQSTLAVLALILVTSLALLVLLGIVDGATLSTPGWASLMTSLILMMTLLVVISTAIIKILSILIQRSTGSPAFLVVDRSKDHRHLNSLNLHFK